MVGSVLAGESELRLRPGQLRRGPHLRGGGNRRWSVRDHLQPDLLLSPRGSDSWEGRSLGEPSCVNSGDGFATCAAVASNNALVAIRFNTQSGANSGFQVLGGQIIDNPSCAPALGGLNQVICAAKTPANALVAVRFAPQTGFTTGFQELGGTLVGDPSCANSGPGFATCAARDVKGALTAIRFSPSTGVKDGVPEPGGDLRRRSELCPCSRRSEPGHLRSASHRQPRVRYPLQPQHRLLTRGSVASRKGPSSGIPVARTAGQERPPAPREPSTIPCSGSSVDP